VRGLVGECVECIRRWHPGRVLGENKEYSQWGREWGVNGWGRGSNEVRGGGLCDERDAP